MESHPVVKEANSKVLSPVVTTVLTQRSFTYHQHGVPGPSGPSVALRAEEKSVNLTYSRF